MSKLLINEIPLQCLPSLAKEIGLNEAIFIQQLHYWVERSNNILDGRKWVYNTVNEWAEQFPFWSTKTLARTISSLKNKKLILSGNYNKKGYDRTKWYTINYDVLEEIENNISNNKSDKNISKKPKNNTVPFIGTNCPTPLGQNDQSIQTNCPNEENQGFEGDLNKNSASVPIIGTKCPNDIDKMSTSIRTNCPTPLGQNDLIHTDRLTSPIPIDYTERTTIDYPEKTTTENKNVVVQEIDIQENSDRAVLEMIAKGINPEHIKKMIKQHGIMNVINKFNILCHSQNVSNPTGWLYAALKDNYNQNNIISSTSESRPQINMTAVQEEVRLQKERVAAEIDNTLINESSPFYKFLQGKGNQ